MRMVSQFLQTHPRRSSPRKATNVTVPPEIVSEAKELGINLSEAFERGLRESIAEVRAVRWKKENREALESYNRFVEEHGLPLADLRLF